LSRPDISVVIPVRNGAGSLPPLLASLRRQTLAPERFEVIVVDNASSDGTAEIARGARATVVVEPVANRSRARNRGIEAARAERIAFTDADCLASEGWLEALLGCGGAAPLMAGPVEVTTGRPPNAVERLEARWRFAQEHWVRQGWAATANLCVERAVLDTVGGFDPAYRHAGEDPDFCLRAGRAGFGLGWCPRAVVRHPAESTVVPVLRRAFRHGHGANQALARAGVGHRAWADPLPAFRGRGALERLGIDPGSLEPGERRRLGRLARLGYAARVAGSVWYELDRVRR
jgi:glycosyltransferase involved in cell wall biosynthesis